MSKLESLRDAYLHYRNVQNGKGSEFIKENGRNNRSPHCEMMEAVYDVLYCDTDQAKSESALAAAAEQLREKDEELKRLGERLAAAESVLREIVCTEPPDDGVVLLSNDSPCYWDAERNIDVYDHVHFSPLGDALMKLYRTLKGTEDVPSQ